MIMMKTNKSVIYISILGLIFLCFLGITTKAQSAITVDIKGRWISDSTPEWKWEFKADGKCYDYFNGILEDTYFYVITSENSPSGLNFHFLELTNINNQNKKFKYELEVNNNTLSVIYIKGAKPKPMLFTRELEEVFK